MEAHSSRILKQTALVNPLVSLRTMRSSHPYRAWERARERRQPGTWPQPLLLAAGDHPARMLTAWRGDSTALADRGRYLRTLVGLLASGAVDGVEATPDVMEDLLVLDSIIVRSDCPSFLDDKVLIGTMNRSGLRGTCFEMVDEDSAFTAHSAKALGLNAVKWMWRLAPEEILTVQSQRALRKGLVSAHETSLPVMLEIDWVERHQDGWTSVMDEPGRMVELVGVASGWGPSSCHRYLELPANEQLEAALNATSLPVVVLPPEQRKPGPCVVNDYQRALELPVAGQLIGRDIMLSEEPVAIAQKVAQAWRRVTSNDG